MFRARAIWPTVNQCEIPGTKAQFILKKMCITKRTLNQSDEIWKRPVELATECEPKKNGNRFLNLNQNCL
jgi:hypothetical protein